MEHNFYHVRLQDCSRLMRILISPLDWGLGHATRDIPIIRALRRAGHEVIIFASGAGRRLLQGEFPDLEIGELPSYSMSYSKSKALLPFWLLAQLPVFIFSVFRERRLVNDLVRDHRIDLIISDGRYGLKTALVPCIFITHQLCILPPGPNWLRSLLSAPIQSLNRFALRDFKKIWVPDFPGAVNLSGRLGHPNPAWPPVQYIFPLCRFRENSLPWNRPAEIDAKDLKIDLLALVSGPEPQRTVFENMLTEALKKMSGTRALVRGLPGQPVGAHRDAPLRELPRQMVRENELNVFDHLSGNDLTQFLAAADKVVCRSGYTSVMELAGLGKRNILLIPTPGQPEQEYLGKHLQKMGLAECQEQEAFSIEIGLHTAAELPGFALLFQNSETQTNTSDLVKSFVL